MKKDIVLGVIHNYGWNEVKNWVMSLHESGFSGRKVLLAYGVKPDLVSSVSKFGIEVFQMDFHSRNERINIPPLKVIDIRHFHTWFFLKEQDENDYRYVIATDVRDVVFQSNPSTWLEEHMPSYGHGKFISPSEGIRLKDEPWNASFMFNGFGPMVFDTLKDKPVVNCGTIAGEFPYFRDFSLTLFSMAERNLLIGLDCIDQTSLTVLSHTIAKRDIWTAPHDVGWACQCGVMLDPQKIEKFRPKLLDPEPVVKDGLVYTSNGNLFTLVHQYDRCNELMIIINERYK
jgi:hypothetical protein